MSELPLEAYLTALASLDGVGPAGMRWLLSHGAPSQVWTGASFEGHFYPRSWTVPLYFLEKYGKATARCIRLK